MAETLGLAANLAAVVGAGLGLSKFLYDFASVLGSASGDVKSLATEITLFCSVLRHTQSVLSQTKAIRISLSAIQTAQDVIGRCQVIFDDLQETIQKVQKGQLQLDLVTRFKWFFKEKRVLLVHEQLKTCGATLNLMLTTLLLAQKIATRRSFPMEAQDGDTHDRLMAHTLFMAQQAAAERLAIVEEEHRLAETQPEMKELPNQHAKYLFGEDSPLSNQRRHQRSQSGRTTSPVQANGSIDRLSTILNKHLSRLSSIETSNTSIIDEDRLSVLQTNELLQHWTDQSDPLATYIKEPPSPPFPLAEMAAQLHVKSPSTERSFAHEDRSTDLEDNDFSPAASQVEIRSNYLNARRFLPIRITTFDGFPVGFDDPCYKVLPALLKKYNIDDDWRSYALYCVIHDREQRLNLEEKPLVLFAHWERLDQTPTFMFRKHLDDPLATIKMQIQAGRVMSLQGLFGAHIEA